MKKHLLLTSFIILAPFLLISCVSSLLKEKAPTFSKEIEFENPTGNYTKLEKAVFPSWKNRATGNVISIFSDCQTDSPKTLNDLQKYIEDSVDNGKRVNENIIQFQNKPALNVLLNGDLEGNPIAVQSTSFVRGNCGYVASLSGKPQQLKLDQPTFNHFLTSFKFK
jgi:hypothetical protein